MVLKFNSFSTIFVHWERKEMLKLKEIKDRILSFLLPVGGKRRKIVQYIYRLIRNKENRIELKEKIHIVL